MEYKEFCTWVATKAWEIMKHYFYWENQISYKWWTEVVTIADQEINQVVIDEVTKSFPTHNVIWEEWDGQAKSSEYSWNTDPIDGTIPYAHGIPVSVFSLALLKNWEPIVWCVYHPFFDELYYAEKWKGAYCNWVKIAVSQRAMTDKWFLMWQSMQKRMPNNVKPIRDDLFNQDIISIDLWTITYMWVLIAKGCIDALIFPHTKQYDLPAVKVIVEEAWWKETDLFWNEQRFDTPIKWNIVSNWLVHDKIVTLSKKHLQ